MKRNTALCLCSCFVHSACWIYIRYIVLNVKLQHANLQTRPHDKWATVIRTYGHMLCNIVYQIHRRRLQDKLLLRKVNILLCETCESCTVEQQSRAYTATVNNNTVENNYAIHAQNCRTNKWKSFVWPNCFSAFNWSISIMWTAWAVAHFNFQQIVCCCCTTRLYHKITQWIIKDQIESEQWVIIITADVAVYNAVPNTVNPLRNTQYYGGGNSQPASNFSDFLIPTSRQSSRNALALFFSVI